MVLDEKHSTLLTFSRSTIHTPDPHQQLLWQLINPLLIYKGYTRKMDILTNCSALPEIGTHKTCLNDVYFFVIYQILFMHAIVLLKEGMLKLFQFKKNKTPNNVQLNERYLWSVSLLWLSNLWIHLSIACLIWKPITLRQSLAYRIEKPKHHMQYIKTCVA